MNIDDVEEALASLLQVVAHVFHEQVNAVVQPPIHLVSVVRADQNVRHPPELRILRQRLCLEDVQPSSHDRPGFQCAAKRSLVDALPSANVDEHGRALHLGQDAGVHDVLRAGNQRGGADNVVALLHHELQVCRAKYLVHRFVPSGQLRVPPRGQDSHPVGLGEDPSCPPNVAKPDDPHGLPRELTDWKLFPTGARLLVQEPRRL
mmetsp:Transcript_8512/g.24323  ORF Transcript_8512/g.24323 Transcript_8512/m.24323 type:complete len:205 (+) Transcript_8512:1118-1732(+)